MKRNASPYFMWAETAGDTKCMAVKNRGSIMANSYQFDMSRYEMAHHCMTPVTIMTCLKRIQCHWVLKLRFPYNLLLQYVFCIFLPFHSWCKRRRLKPVSYGIPNGLYTSILTIDISFRDMKQTGQSTWPEMSEGCGARYVPTCKRMGSTSAAIWISRSARVAAELQYKGSNDGR